MRRLLFIALTLLSTLLPGLAHAWWQAEWAYRKPVTIDGGPQAGAIGSDAGRMPVLVRLHTGNFKFEGVSETGADLRFVAGDDKTVLNHQIEQFDPLLGIALIWVDVPNVSAGTPQKLWMYYGNPKAPASGNGQRSFDPDYTLVYHFAEGAVPPRDTTAYGNNGQTAAVPVEGTVIGKGAQLGNGALMLPATPSLAVTAGGTLTFSAWIKPDSLGARQAIYARRDGAGELVVGIDQGVPFVQVNGQRSTPGQPVQAGQWSHLAVKAEGDSVALYVGGRPAVSLAAKLPALNTAAALGADAPAAAPAAPGAAPVAGFAPFTGAIDEVRLSKVARPDALLLADAVSQGAESRLAAFGPDEQQAGKSHFGFILAAMPLDAWIVVGLLGLMMALSWAIMIGKGRNFGATSRANATFIEHFREAAGAPLDRLATNNTVPQEVRADSSLWRLYEVAIEEMRRRHDRGYDLNAVSASTIGAIRAAMDGVMVRETERMSKRMNWLSTTIEGAPYVGLFGTVIGIMLVFVVAAMAGAVDINSVAPGMAAALLCTAAGLGVAIPALFGYNWLASRSDAIGADMAVFVDEFVTRLAEEQGEGRSLPVAVQARRA
ncbi:biopolymer transport protein ExbB [Variovorax boronicumulans]|uniref:Biopolymer transport protein ExbB n=1 Tax=Variovorax boronicumulans TaxID=436515 RepID=A0AAW8DP18_9BURK|nr:MotA/TolQ/ExbB proton channel family protein [Variovorax boronicumulans]MDP9875866.1 biopolymer transport protein ExbB [Variovorax boronicumulans]MDP9917214.1 biopolymer transport protein ExbB [Variovorax boronicumulans]MDP9921149.1 biopolymer transport protein ExbB [Variovorax boronicumulans]